MTDNSKIILVILISLLFIFVGLFLSIKFNRPQLSISQLTDQQLIITPSPTPIREKAKVSFVFDGDTIELSDKRRVRYIGINAPELNTKDKKPQCFATDSAKINKELVLGQEIEMEKDVSEKDKYGRLLRYVYLDGILVNEFLIRQGFARLDLLPPDLKFADQLRQAEKEARENERGMWGRCR